MEDEQQPCIAKGIIQSISKMWKNHELFEDFQVTVDGDNYACHSLILGSCSEFFSGLLRSNMKEKQEMKVEINNISSPTFKLIINSLYTGCELLTKENVLDVWSAVHQLQIQFLIEHCENCVMANLSLDTVQMYKKHAEHLQSERICKYILNFICEHFDTFRKSSIFLELSFQDLMNIIKSDKLQVNCEDEVLNSICDWVNYGSSGAISAATANESMDAFQNNVMDKVSSQNKEEPKEGPISSKVNCDSMTEKEHFEEEPNERKSFLIPLIKSSRYCLASELCILRPYNDKLIQSDVLIKEILFEAFTFKCSHFWQGRWPTAAIHRDCSNLEHVGVFCDTGSISALSFKQAKWFYMASLPEQLCAKLTIFKGYLYACSVGNAPNEIYVLESNMWISVTYIEHAVELLLTHEKYIYLFQNYERHILRFNPESYPINLEMFEHEIENLAYALSFHNHIVTFSSVDNNGVEETAIHSWNTETQVWTKLDNLNFSCQNMISFCSDRDTYIFDSYGNLWKAIKAAMIQFAFVAKLWNGHYNIKGAVLFRETLFIFGNFPEGFNDLLLHEVQGVCSSTNVTGGFEDRPTISNVVHYVSPTNELDPEQPTLFQ